MKYTKETFVLGFALFSMFFGAGNLILPPFLGFKSGENWEIVSFGFVLSAVFLPLLGIFAYARIQGTMQDFGKKVSPLFGVIYGILLYFIAVTLPIPRTASVTHEIAIQPFFSTPSLLTSSIYFGLVFIILLNRSKVIDILGKFLTPFIIFIVFLVIILGLFIPANYDMQASLYTTFSSGIIEGYQTFDAIGSVVAGSMIIVSLKLRGYKTYESIYALLSRAGIIAAIGLLTVYIGLIYVGAKMGGDLPADMTRTELLLTMSHNLIGNTGKLLLSVLVAVACFTTAVGVLAGASDFFKSLFNNSEKAYKVAALTVCSLGVLFGQLPVSYIIAIALPVLMFIYPITIVLIILNVLPEKLASATVFRIVVLVTFIFSIPDFLEHIPLFKGAYLQNIKTVIPLATDGFAWVLPAILAFSLAVLFKTKTSESA